jgi:hypothetical protein
MEKVSLPQETQYSQADITVMIIMLSCFILPSSNCLVPFSGQIDEHSCLAIAGVPSRVGGRGEPAEGRELEAEEAAGIHEEI